MPEYVPVKARKHRYRQFAAKYVENGCNGLRTAIDCGFTDNPDSAKSIATRLLTYAYVDQQIKKHLMNAKISADEVLEELSSIARTPIDKYSEAAKLKALELSGKALKLFVDKVETTDTSVVAGVSDGLLRSIESAAQRDQCDPSHAAVELYAALSDQPRLADINNWPPQFQQCIRDSLNKPSEPAITEIGDQ